MRARYDLEQRRRDEEEEEDTVAVGGNGAAEAAPPTGPDSVESAGTTQRMSQDTASSSITSAAAGDRGGGYRKVRFSFLDRESLPAPPPPQPAASGGGSAEGSSSQTSNNSSGGSSSRSSGRRRRRKRSADLWLRDDDDDEEEEEEKGDTIDAEQLVDDDNDDRMVRAAKRDMESLLESGHVEMLVDEASFLINSILSQRKKQQQQSPTSSPSQLSESVCELAFLLAEKKNRQAILGDEELSESIIDIISFRAIDDWTRGGTTDQCVSALIHFVTLECTTVDRRGVPTKEAQALRTAFLKAPAALQAILGLIINDPITTNAAGGQRERAIVSSAASPPPQSPCRSATSSACASPPSSAGSRRSLASVDTPDSQGSVSTCSSTGGKPDDPTKAGRRRRRNKKPKTESNLAAVSNSLEPIPEHNSLRKRSKGSAEKDQLSFHSESTDGYATIPSTTHRIQVEALSSRVEQSMAVQSKASENALHGALRQLPTPSASKSKKIPHACKNPVHRNTLLTSIPLLGLNRIISCKMEGDGGVGASAGGGIDPMSLVPLDHDDDDEGDESDLLNTNEFISKADIVPLLSQALVETLAAFLRLSKISCDKRDSPTHKGGCRPCLKHIVERAKALVSTIDGACLFHKANRRDFCRNGRLSRAILTGARQASIKSDGANLVACLISVIKSLLLDEKACSSLFEGSVGEILLEILRTLTSLTHENATAAQQLTTYGDNSLEVLARVLQLAVSISDDGTSADAASAQKKKATISTSNGKSGDEDINKHKYDVSLLCLNIMTNVVESGASPQYLSAIDVGKRTDIENPNFFLWLVHWIIDQTRSFRDAIAESTFGAPSSSPSKHSGRHLEDQEDEKLVLAGNGFVLLACLLLHDDEATSGLVEDAGKKRTKKKAAKDVDARQVVLSELPGSDDGSKISFVINTLKAFCNFYHMTVGDLSVAVVAPVKILMGKLEGLRGD